MYHPKKKVETQTFSNFFFHGSAVLIPNFCSLGEMGHFSYVAFDHHTNKQRVQKEAQWRRKREYQIACNEDKNEATIEDYHSGAY